MPPRSTPTSRKPTSRSRVAAVAERLSVLQTRTTGLSLRASISTRRRGISPTGIFDASAMTREFVGPAHVDHRDSWAPLEPARKPIHLDPLGLLFAAQAPRQAWEERDCGQQREGDQAVADRGRVAGGGLAAGMAEPGVGHRARHHADKRRKNIVRQGNTREAKRIVGEVEREEGHEPHEGNEAPALRLDPGDQVGKFLFDISKPITNYGGEIYLYKGDGLIALWNWNEAIRRNRILRAIDAIFASVRREQGEYQRQFGVVPRFRIGVHGGEVVVSEQGDTKRAIGVY